MDDQPSTLIQIGDAYAFVDDGVIMVKASDAFGDPVELTEEDAIRLATWLKEWASRLGGGHLD